MINELFEISCKTPHFCISLQLRLLKSELIWNIPSSTSSHHGQRRRQKLMWRRLHTPRSSSKVDQGASLRVISSARSLLNDWSYHETLSHIWFITLRTWLPTDANYKALSNRSNFLSTTYKTSQKRLQAKRFYHKCPNIVQWRAWETNMGTRCLLGKLFQSKLMANMKALTYKPLENMLRRLYY